MNPIESIGNSQSATLVDSRKVGQEPFGKIPNYIKKQSSDGASFYSDPLASMQGEIANAGGSLFKVDRTIPIAKMAELSVVTPERSFNMKIIIDALSGDRDVGNGHVSMVAKSDDGNKFAVSDTKYIVEPKVSLKGFISLVNDLAKGGFITDDGLEGMSKFSRVNSVSAVDLFETIKNNLKDGAIDDKEFIKTTSKAQIDFEKDLFISDFRGIRIADTNLLNAVNKGYYKESDYNEKDVAIINDIKTFMEANDIKIESKVTNTNMLLYGHNELGSVVIQKNETIPEYTNGYLFKELGLNDAIKDITYATNDAKGILSRNPLADEDKNKIAKGLGIIKMLALQTNDDLIIKSANRIDPEKIANANSFKSIQKEFNDAMTVAFAVKAHALNEYSKTQSILKPTLTESGDGRIRQKKFGYELPEGIGLDSETMIQRLAKTHEVRIKDIKTGYEGGVQVKSKSVAALTFIFDKEGAIKSIDNAASLSQYNATWNKLGLMIDILANGKYDADTQEKRPLTDDEFAKMMYKGAISGKTEKNEPIYSNFGIQHVADILLSQKTNKSSGEAVVAFKKIIEGVAKSGGTSAVAEHIKNSNDSLVEVFREFSKLASSQYSKNKSIGMTQWKNRDTLKDSEPNPTKEIMSVIFSGSKPEDLAGSYDKQNIGDANKIIGKALYAQTAMKVSDSIEKERVQELVRSGALSQEVSKYYDVANVAKSIGIEDYKIKNRVDRYYNRDLGVSQLSSANGGFQNKTDAGLLSKNSDDSLTPDENVLKKHIEKLKTSKKDLSEIVSELFLKQISSTRDKTSRLTEGESETLNITAPSSSAASTQAQISSEEGTESDRQNETEANEPEVQAAEDYQQALVGSIAEDIETSTPESTITVDIDKEEIEAPQNDIGIDLGMFDDEEEDIEVQSPSKIATELQEDNEPAPIAVGVGLLK